MSDPRYDPRFQRGWDGDPEPRNVARPEPSALARPDRPDPPSAEPSPVRAESAPDPASASAPPAPEDEGWIEAPRFNPFRIALAVVGVALLGLGAWLTWVMAQDAQNSSTPMDPVLSQLPLLLTPSVVLAGLVAIIAAIAVGGRRR